MLLLLSMWSFPLLLTTACVLLYTVLSSPEGVPRDVTFDLSDALQQAGEVCL